LSEHYVYRCNLSLQFRNTRHKFWQISLWQTWARRTHH